MNNVDFSPHPHDWKILKMQIKKKNIKLMLKKKKQRIEKYSNQ